MSRENDSPLNEKRPIESVIHRMRYRSDLVGNSVEISLGDHLDGIWEVVRILEKPDFLGLVRVELKRILH